MISSSIGVWIAAILTILLWTVLAKESHLYRFAEHTYLGVYAGYAFAMAMSNVLNYGIVPISEGSMLFIVPILLGVLIYARYIPSVKWLYRYPMSMLIGIGMGLAIRGTIDAQFVRQISATAARALVTTSLRTSIDNILFVTAAVAVLIFFLFGSYSDRLRKGPVRYVMTYARYMMMVAFGSAYALAVMTRTALLIGRLQFILGDWLGLI